MKIRAIEKYNNNIICYFEFPKKLDKTAYIALIEFYIQTILFRYISDNPFSCLLDNIQ